MRGWRHRVSKGRKAFFFEKKKQKPFSPALLELTPRYRTGAGANEQKFFGSFFSKKNTFFWFSFRYRNFIAVPRPDARRRRPARPAGQRAAFLLPPPLYRTDHTTVSYPVAVSSPSTRSEEKRRYPR
jgi:hypothetical protein